MVKQPMDLHEVLQRVERKEVTTVAGLRRLLYLICDNAMVYNGKVGGPAPTPAPAMLCLCVWWGGGVHWGKRVLHRHACAGHRWLHSGGGCGWCARTLALRPFAWHMLSFISVLGVVPGL